MGVQFAVVTFRRRDDAPSRGWHDTVTGITPSRGTPPYLPRCRAYCQGARKGGAWLTRRRLLAAVGHGPSLPKQTFLPPGLTDRTSGHVLSAFHLPDPPLPGGREWTPSGPAGRAGGCPSPCGRSRPPATARPDGPSTAPGRSPPGR